MLRDALMQISRGKYNGSTQLSHLKPSITTGLPLGRTEIPETKSPSVFLPPCQPSALPPLGSSQGLRAQDLSSSKPELSQLGFTPLYTHCNSGSAFCRKDFLRMQIHTITDTSVHLQQTLLVTCWETVTFLLTTPTNLLFPPSAGLGLSASLPHPITIETQIRVQ